jgi:hypothetical protein
VRCRRDSIGENWEWSLPSGSLGFATLRVLIGGDIAVAWNGVVSKLVPEFD